MHRLVIVGFLDLERVFAKVRHRLAVFQQFPGAVSFLDEVPSVHHLGCVGMAADVGELLLSGACSGVSLHGAWVGPLALCLWVEV